jgi:hypothetical protein
MFLNYRRTLVMNQPSDSSCVHVIDTRWAEQSQHDTDEITQLFPHSKIEFALTENEAANIPLKFAFGAEPIRGWCYFYQKADLARQQGDWEAVAKLEAKAASLGFSPSDLIEWTPFIQAYAYLGQTEKVEALAAHFKGDSFHNSQVCENLTRMDENGYPLKPEMQSKVNELFCQP